MAEVARDDRRALWALALAVATIHLAFAGRYGFFRDELYFIACGQRPSLGYVDHPPLVPLLAAAWDHLGGGSLTWFRIIPALAHGALVLLTGLLARALGGGPRAAFLAAIAPAVAPGFLVSGHLFTMNSLEPVLWTTVSLGVVRQLRGAPARGWLWIGALVGVGLTAKYSMAFWAVALFAGVVATGHRRLLASRWLVAGAAIAIALPLPSVIWQAQHDWPFLELLRAGQAGKNVELSLLDFLRELIGFLHPLTLPLWLAGAVHLARRERALAIAFAIFLVAMIALGAKPYYAAPAFPLLYAAGAVSLGGWLDRARWRVAALAAPLIVTGAALAPMVVPVLPVDTMIRYQRALGIQPPRAENKEYGDLQQHLADQFGWPELGAAAAAAFRALPPDDQRHAAVYTMNYGEAAAIERFGGVPAISGHNQYGVWGPAPADGRVVIIVGGDEADHTRAFTTVRRVGTGPSSPYMMPYERALPIYEARGARLPVAELWRRARHID